MAGTCQECTFSFLPVKGTNGRQKTYEVSHVYSILSNYRNFWNNERWKSVLNTLAS